MACLEEKEMIAYLKSEISEEKVASFVSHIETCDECAAKFYRTSEAVQDETFIQRTLDLVRELQK